ncbi:MAG: 1-(5-phosphoribosyl)-5-amino-4-imidazole-carboxylate carboxylase, partial [Lachnospiraceae bacterium]|nr:1-(5-phosphoribosyl)-5-amino-4-imidazole-carboxylate carboxylase [Lachnospiraceae bacterium]
MNEDIRSLLEGVKAGTVSIEEAVLKLKTKPFEDIGFAKVDTHRKLRQGVAEVIYGAGKTPEQIIRIADVMKKNGQSTILITRLSKESAEEVEKAHPMEYYPEARCGVIGEFPKADVL